MDIKKKRSNNGRINNLYELLIDPREREKGTSGGKRNFLNCTSASPPRLL